MTMTDFSKKIIDLENRITSHSDDLNQKLVDLESKVIGYSDDIKKLQDTTNQIEQQPRRNYIKSEINHNQTMTLLNTLCERMKVTPEQLLQDDGGNQHHNLSDSINSTDSHEKAVSEKVIHAPSRK